MRRTALVLFSAFVVGSLIALRAPVAAQDVSPVPDAGGHPAHIHSGTCDTLGDVVYPLNDAVAPIGAAEGSAAATVAATSFSTVDAALADLLAGEFAVNVHLSNEDIGTYIACSEIGGPFQPDGSIVIGLRPVEDSGFAGVAYLIPAADNAAQTNVSLFVFELAPGEAAETGGGEADTGETAANTVSVSLSEFVIDVPTELTAGETTFEISNDGTVEHGFEIEGEGIEEELEPTLQPGETGTLTVDLAPGTYEIYCPVGDHRDQGMSVEVTVA